MTRGDKVKRFLTGGALVIGGILSLIFLKQAYIIGIILAAFGIISLLGKGGKSSGGISLALGAGLIVIYYLFGGYIFVAGILAILSGGYLGFDTYKKLNAP